MLRDVWNQVKKLHAANIAHRDLRAANIMIDPSGKAWIIDYGFAEVSPNTSRKHMDIAELLMSMSLVAGVDKTADAAVRVLGKDHLKKALVYVHKSVFSGDTNQQLRRNRKLLGDLRERVKTECRIEDEQNQT